MNVATAPVTAPWDHETTMSTVVAGWVPFQKRTVPRTCTSVSVKVMAGMSTIQDSTYVFTNWLTPATLTKRVL
ncbi:hypothetical protein D3C85_1692760 [compost metagenome]